jgi:hypothetical protein
MSPSRVTLAAITTLFVVCSTATASADLPPPPGYVETCTIENQLKPSDECFSCAAYHGNSTHCSDSLSEYGFTQRCQTRGASVWREVWCRAKSGSAKEVPKDIIAQLGNSMNRVKPAAVPSAADPIDAPPANPSGAPTTEPTTVSSSTPSAAPSHDATPQPQPVPPPARGCGSCLIGGGTASSAAGLLALVTLAACAWRRRRLANVRARK